MGAEGMRIGSSNASPTLDQLTVVIARQWLSRSAYPYLRVRDCLMNRGRTGL